MYGGVRAPLCRLLLRSTACSVALARLCVFFPFFVCQPPRKIKTPFLCCVCLFLSLSLCLAANQSGVVGCDQAGRPEGEGPPEAATVDTAGRRWLSLQPPRLSATGWGKDFCLSMHTQKIRTGSARCPPPHTKGNEKSGWEASPLGAAFSFVSQSEALQCASQLDKFQQEKRENHTREATPRVPPFWPHGGTSRTPDFPAGQPPGRVDGETVYRR